MSKKSRRHKVGGYGHRVTLFQRPGRRGFYVKYTDPKQGAVVQKGLGHHDFEQALQDARAISDALRLKRAVPMAETPPTLDEPSFALLFRLYRENRSPAKHGTGSDEDKRRVALFLHFFKQKKVSRPSDLDDDVITAFVSERLHGDLQVPGLRLRAPAPPARPDERRANVVSHRTVDADLVFLASVLNWASRKRLGGRALLQKERVMRMPRVRATSVNQPVMDHETHRELLRVADAVCGQRLLGCFLRLLDDLGWRLKGVAHIRGTDLDFSTSRTRPYGTLRKNPLVDKVGQGGQVALSRHARATLNRLLRIRGLESGSDELLFPMPLDNAQPWSRWHFYRLLRAAETRAGVAHVGGAHSWRRKWATERKGLPSADVMMAGGWNDPNTFHRSYSKPDSETLLRVVSTPRLRVRRQH